jgi:hypothetical protein
MDDRAREVLRDFRDAFATDPLDASQAGKP